MIQKLFFLLCGLAALAFEMLIIIDHFSFTFGKYFKFKEAAKHRKNSCAWCCSSTNPYNTLSWCCLFFPATGNFLGKWACCFALYFALSAGPMWCFSSNLCSVYLSRVKVRRWWLRAHAARTVNMCFLSSTSFVVLLFTQNMLKMDSYCLVHEKKRKNLPKIFTESYEKHLLW